jgi:DNA-binding protein YbaB
MILSAVNAALAQSKEVYSAEMGKVTSGLSLPGLV